jgi:hypothetical protein
MAILMENVQLQIAFELMCCPMCGITFAFPAEYASCKRQAYVCRDGDDDDTDEYCVKCPNGHDAMLVAPPDNRPTSQEMEEARKEIARLKRELMRAIHTREQTEGHSQGEKK